MKSYERLAFFLLLATLPFQLGKHFWPSFAFVQGIRVDYLSPTLYLSDIFFVLLFIFSSYRLRNEIRKVVFDRLFAFIMSGVVISSLFAVEPMSSLYGVLRLLQFVYIALYIAASYREIDAFFSLFVLTLGGLTQTVIALFQFVSQHSIGGVFYFLGERTFGASTPGIAAFRMGEELVLRPYGTFPHPNVLGFYLLSVFTLLLFSVRGKEKIVSFFQFIALSLLTIGVFITFSRVIIVLYFLVVAVWSVKTSRFRKATRVRIALASLFFLFSTIALLFGRFSFTLLRDTLLRLDLLSVGWKVFLKHPFFGVGLQNFYYHEIIFQKSITPTLLQPIHNAFFMWVVQGGFVGLVGLVLFLDKTIKRIKIPLSVLFLGMLIVVSLFDHYLVTLQQGQMMASLIVGFLYAKRS